MQVEVGGSPVPVLEAAHYLLNDVALLLDGGLTVRSDLALIFDQGDSLIAERCQAKERYGVLRSDIGMLEYRGS